MMVAALPMLDNRKLSKEEKRFGRRKGSLSSFGKRLKRKLKRFTRFLEYFVTVFSSIFGY